jgi:4'-phosphopantetheinyl transferase
MMEITVYYISAKENDFSSLPEDFFSLEEKAKIERCKNPSVKQERIASAYLKKILIGDYEIDEKGKPHAKGIHFNVSHSKGHVVLVKATCPVGIDIEEIREVKQDLIDFVCSPEEKTYIDNEEKFFEVWTNKEAILKAKGIGLRNDLKGVPSLPLDGKKEYEGKTYLTKMIRYRCSVITLALESEEAPEVALTIKEIHL